MREGASECQWVWSGARQCECECAEGGREGCDNKQLVVLIWRVLEYYIGVFFWFYFRSEMGT